MKYDHPQVETVIAFLLSRGWTITGKNKAAYYLAPPKGVVFDEPFQYEVPANTSLKDHNRFLTYSIHSIAEMYGYKYQVLYDLFCYDYKDVENVLAPREVLAEAA
ncbi:MAG TPA: hypothetical protein ENJ95_03330 [Bacteroidetes bacterium]|nr:hypothetical protein [Bacteroidota bacterium]